MATGKIARGTHEMIQAPGTYALGIMICAGYNTGSGNYFDFTIPVSVKGNRTIAAISIADGASIMLMNGTSLSSARIASCKMLDRSVYQIQAEITYDSTQTSNLAGVLTGAITLTVT